MTPAPPPAVGGHVTHHADGCAGLYGLVTHAAPVDADSYTVDLEALRDMAIAGLGIIRVSAFMVRDAIAAAGCQLLHKPLNLMGLLKGAVIDATLEVLAPVRDSRFAAELLKTGGDTRIQGAIDFLNEVIRKVESQHGQPPLKHIELTVYGHDYGATLARAFLHELLSREPQPSGDTYSYQGIKLTILFAGLFDGVDRSHVDFPYLPLPLRTVLDDGGPLPDRVKQALHLVAGEEDELAERRQRLMSLEKAAEEVREADEVLAILLPLIHAFFAEQSPT